MKVVDLEGLRALGGVADGDFVLEDRSSARLRDSRHVLQPLRHVPEPVQRAREDGTGYRLGAHHQARPRADDLARRRQAARGHARHPPGAPDP